MRERKQRQGIKAKSRTHEKRIAIHFFILLFHFVNEMQYSLAVKNVTSKAKIQLKS